MGMVRAIAQRLAAAVLEGEDPKDFLRRMSHQRKIDVRHAGEQPVTPCEQWPEWDDLEDWQQIAAKELEDDRNAYFQLHNHDHLSFQVSDSHNEWFTVFSDENAAVECAEASVREDLEHEPQNFNQNFLTNFINLDKVRRDLHDFARDDDYWNDQWPEYEDKIAKLIEDNLLGEDPLLSSTGRKRKLTPKVEKMIDDLWEKMIEDFANERLEDPIGFLEDINGREEAVKEAMRIGGIDITACAERAVSLDGWRHYLSHNDGLSHDLPGGAIYVLH